MDDAFPREPFEALGYNCHSNRTGRPPPRSRSRVTRGIVCQRNPARSLDKSSSPARDNSGVAKLGQQALPTALRTPRCSRLSSITRAPCLEVSPEGEPSRAPRVALSGGTSRNEHKQQMSSAPPPPGEGGAFSLTPDSSCKRPDPPRCDGSGAGHNAPSKSSARVMTNWINAARRRSVRWRGRRNTDEGQRKPRGRAGASGSL